jgi:hypothetical protein
MARTDFAEEDLTSGVTEYSLLGAGVFRGQSLTILKNSVYDTQELHAAEC